MAIDEHQQLAALLKTEKALARQYRDARRHGDRKACRDLIERLRVLSWRIDGVLRVVSN